MLTMLISSATGNLQEVPHPVHHFVVFTRQRSASTTLISTLNQHPSIFAWFELFNKRQLNGQLTRRQRAASKAASYRSAPENGTFSHHPVPAVSSSSDSSPLPPKKCICNGRLYEGVSIVDTMLLADSVTVGSHQQAMHSMHDGFLDGYWDRFCPRVVPPGGACGFKVFSEHLTGGVGPLDLIQSDPPRPIRAIVLERHNVSAEFASVQRALSTRIWATNPVARRSKEANESAVSKATMQRTAASTYQSTRAPKRAVRTSRALSDKDVPEFERFAAKHRLWFDQVHEALAETRTPTLNVSFEELTSSKEAFDATFARMLAFLEQPSFSIPGGSLYDLHLRVAAHHAASGDGAEPPQQCPCSCTPLSSPLDKVAFCHFNA